LEERANTLSLTDVSGHYEHVGSGGGLFEFHLAASSDGHGISSAMESQRDRATDSAAASRY